jgi:hypothetical protein
MNVLRAQCAVRTLRNTITPPLIFRREKWLHFCAADIFVMSRGSSARTCLSYSVSQLSNESDSEFSRRPIHNRNISDKKNQKTKSSAAGSPFLLTFLAKQKSESRRGAPFIGTRSEGRERCSGWPQ